ncbi:MAG: hypothetical protein KBC81_01720 [Candidatus Pacebacteria bacterium]|nr:hypothetical protein [Candidatus Paceibacterota bacterium]
MQDVKIKELVELTLDGATVTGFNGTVAMKFKGEDDAQTIKKARASGGKLFLFRWDGPYRPMGAIIDGRAIGFFDDGLITLGADDHGTSGEYDRLAINAGKDENDQVVLLRIKPRFIP